MTNDQSRQNIHACALVLGQQGVLIRGPSGSGKTTLAQRLIDHWQSLNKYSAWICDDRVDVDTNRSISIATAVPEIAGLAEKRFLGIVDVDHQSQGVVDLEICLVPQDELARYPEAQTSALNTRLASMKVPERNAELAVELIIERLKQI